jgi:alpha-tubulin suppressor-like RCC1 family protein
MRRCSLAALIVLGIAPATASASIHQPGKGEPGSRQLGALGPLAAGMAHTRASQPGISAIPSATEPHWACPDGLCDAILDPRPTFTAGRWRLPASAAALEGSGEYGGFDPQDLQSAYRIPTSGTAAGQTIAVVDAFGYPGAEEDLARYRERYGLPACTSANGCFAKVNESGEEGNYPPAGEEGWEDESGLDLDMASAACPECHIMLVEAASAYVNDLGEAVNTAARLGATEISNSYGLPEEECGPSDCEEFSVDYDHPGVVVTAAAGDSGYDNFRIGASSPSFPASSPDVVAVGGTSLTHSGNGSRGWSEEPWFLYFEGGTGGGCTISEPKPTWQKDSGCATRTENDVAAVAACMTPVSVYVGGWTDACGTSASAPLVAGIAAHASAYARSLPGADAFYQDLGAIFDITAGTNGECILPAERAYLCYAGPGYDGPTGLGSPLGALSLAGAAPSLATAPASAVSDGAATLSGRLDPQGLATSYHFEYGETTSYGISVPVPDAPAGSGTVVQRLSTVITGLHGETTYHYRLVASNEIGTSYGNDETFITGSPSVGAVTPASGPLAGGDTVTISGANLAGAIAVEFGADPATSFKVLSASTISAIAPAGAGTVEVTVRTPAGTSVLSPADSFSYALGPVLGWGNNENEEGDLGNEALASHHGPAQMSDVPVEVNAVPEASALAAGSHHSLAVLQSGEVMAWGEGVDGELGDGTRRGSVRAVKVCAPEVTSCLGGPYLDEVSSVAAGEGFSLALLASGVVMAWGEDTDGQLGIGDELGSRTPAPVCLKRESPCKPENYLTEVIAVAAGKSFSLALLRNGTVMAWGEDDGGQLGKGAGYSKCGPSKDKCSWNPHPVTGLSEVTALAAGNEFSLALERDGTVKAWGEGVSGALGDGARRKSTVPVTVCASGQHKPCGASLVGVKAIAAGARTSYALLQDGTVAAWGSNSYDALADGASSGPEACGSEGACAKTPVAVSGVSGASAIAAGISSNEGLAALEDGDLVTWGSGYSGELGDGADGASDVAVRVCPAYASGPCPSGPYLSGHVSAMAVGGSRDFVSLAAGP